MKTELKKIAQLRGGDCLGPSQENLPTLNDPSKPQIKPSRMIFLWKCEKGHTWNARADSVIRGSWCPICVHHNQKRTIEEMRELAKQKGGECLSQIYEDSHTKLNWKCKNGHIFAATPSHVKHGRWCRECGRKSSAINRRLSLQEIHDIAKSHNGKCISEEYDPQQQLEWQCEMGHTWYANLHNVKSGSWCPECGHKKSGRKPLSIEEMRDIATSHGGQCLSEQFINVDTKLKWKCEKGHVWMSLPSSVKKGHWCLECSGNKMLDLVQTQKIAQERGGICLSTTYLGVHQKLKWQCAEGHTWLANYSNISIGRWCPICSAGIGERICRAYFEQMFGKEFPKSRPIWLINQDGYQMELDGYCSDLALAFEHQGRQHYQHNDFFYSNNEQFQKRQDDDSRKEFLCVENKILLITIPQIPDLLPLDKVKQYILDSCRVNNFQPPENSQNIVVKLQKAYSPTAKEKMQQINEIASNLGGICLSSTYLGRNKKLRFKCEFGHEWETIPDVIITGHWCPKCSSTKRGLVRRLTIDEMHQMAKEHNGRCLSNDYINANTHLLWECSKGHQWLAIPNSIKRGSWCSICSKEYRRSK